MNNIPFFVNFKEPRLIFSEASELLQIIRTENNEKDALFYAFCFVMIEEDLSNAKLFKSLGYELKDGLYVLDNADRLAEKVNNLKENGILIDNIPIDKVHIVDIGRGEVACLQALRKKAMQMEETEVASKIENLIKTIVPMCYEVEIGDKVSWAIRSHFLKLAKELLQRQRQQQALLQQQQEEARRRERCISRCIYVFAAFLGIAIGLFTPSGGRG